MSSRKPEILSTEDKLFADLVRSGLTCCREELLTRVYSLASDPGLGTIRATIQRRLMRQARELAEHEEFLHWLASRSLTDASHLVADLLWNARHINDIGAVCPPVCTNTVNMRFTHATLKALFGLLMLTF
jgi:hypothetical protein